MVWILASTREEKKLRLNPVHASKKERVIIKLQFNMPKPITKWAWQ